MAITLSVLDQSPKQAGQTDTEALNQTVILAREAERLGYQTFWAAEHHNSDKLASSAPEVIVAYLLAQTKKIKIGSGGVMLQHYSPYKVAEVFNTLSSLEPDRVRLGVGKAPGGLPLSTKALQSGKAAESFDKLLAELIHFIRNDFAPDHPYYELKAFPVPEQAPPVFLLGGSVESAILAAKQGISYVFAHFINGDEAVLKEAAEAFNDYLPPGSPAGFQLATSVYADDSDEEARLVLAEREIVKVKLESGRSVNLGTIEQAETFIRESHENGKIFVQKAGHIAGSKETVGREIRRLSDAYAIDRFIVLTPVESFEKRLRSYALLQEAITEKVIK